MKRWYLELIIDDELAKNLSEISKVIDGDEEDVLMKALHEYVEKMKNNIN